MKRYSFPFGAIIGQEKLKKALILNVINPKIGGVLVCGEKGTAKSTAVRGLTEVLTHMAVVDLPLNITEDRLLGSINIESAICEGKRKIDYGILKKAHNNILYIDEVNLLSEHIVNSILSVAANGENRIEREGFSEIHACDFVLVGTMNPEEGSLRSAFLDRFGLYVEIEGCKDISHRVEILKRRLEFEDNPIEFIKSWSHEANVLRERIEHAKNNMKKIIVKEQAMNIAAQLSSKSNCHGHRGEIVLIETSKAIAALDGREYINVEDIKEAAELALPHRVKENQPQNKEDKNEIDDDNNEENNENDSKEEEPKENNNEKDQNKDIENDKKEEREEFDENDENQSENTEEEKEDENNEGLSEFDDEIFDIGNIFKVKDLNIKPMDKRKRSGSGKRIKTKASLKEGRYIRYRQSKGKVSDLAFDATIRAAAPYQKMRNTDEVAISICDVDIKEKVREKRTGSTILFVVDGSSSMGAQKRMEAVKGAIVSLLTDAYEKRDKVGMVVFRKDCAELLLDITRSVDLAQKELKYMPTGGKTPLAHGLEKAYEVLEIRRKKEKDMMSVMVVITDGRTNFHKNSDEPFEEAIKISRKIREKDIKCIVIDCEQGFIKLEMAKELSEALGADYHKIDDISDGSIVKVIEAGR